MQNNRNKPENTNKKLDRVAGRNRTRAKGSDKKPDNRTHGSTKPRPKKLSNREKLQKRPAIIAGVLNESANTKISIGSDRFLVESISGIRNNIYSQWNPDSIRLARTIASLKRKNRGYDPKQDDEVLFKNFKETQIVPPMNSLILGLVKREFDEYFKDFDLDAAYKHMMDINRKKLITQGVNAPSNLAPIYTGDQVNSDLILGMKLGKAVFQPNVDPSTVLKWVADGKFTSVPKNSETNRGITVGAAEMIDYHDAVSTMLRDHCTQKSHSWNHIIQFNQQEVQHQGLIPGMSTIDKSSASDRVYLKAYNNVWPAFMEKFSHILPKNIAFKGEIVDLTCVGTQGYPLTFTLMSILIGLTISAVKKYRSVIVVSMNYGDDAIVPEEIFDDVCTALVAIGLKINYDKTFKSSDGFLESCGKDVILSKYGIHDVTPVFLRDNTDVAVIEFCHQLCEHEIVSPETATLVLDKCNVDYFAFEHDFKVTEFHFPHGPVKNVPVLRDFNKEKSRYEFKAPYMNQEIDSIKGASKSDSRTILELLEINAALKLPETHEEYIRGKDLFAQPHRLNAITAKPLYGAYLALNDHDVHEHISYEQIAEDYKISLTSVFYYVFITSELQKYRYSSPTVDFIDYETFEFEIQDVINSVLDISAEVIYPIYRYRPSKKTKWIEHPLSALHLKLK